MKLKTVQVRMFRNILDSTEVKIEGKVTCLVGKNESGKSAFLNALLRGSTVKLDRVLGIAAGSVAAEAAEHHKHFRDPGSVTVAEIDQVVFPAFQTSAPEGRELGEMASTELS